jgi:uncharacterized membrane protein
MGNGVLRKSFIFSGHAMPACSRCAAGESSMLLPKIATVATLDTRRKARAAGKYSHQIRQPKSDNRM